MRWGTVIAVTAIVVEVIGIMQMNAWVGGWITLGLLVAGVVVGLQLSRFTGKRAMGEVERAVQSGKRPDEEIMGGLVTFLAAILFVVPGFVGAVQVMSMGLSRPIRIPVPGKVSASMPRPSSENAGTSAPAAASVMVSPAANGGNGSISVV